MSKNNQNGDAITGKLLYCGHIKIETPLLIGTGEQDSDADTVVLKDDAGYPYIPATSLVGVTRHYYKDYCEIDTGSNRNTEAFWGAARESSDTNQFQSALFVRDLIMIEEDKKSVKISLRDGIKINPETGIAEDKKKFEYEIVEPGVCFNFYAEVSLRKSFDKEMLKKIMDCLLTALSEGEIQIGAKTTRGFGRCKLINCKHQELNFEKRKDVLTWLKKKYNFQEYKCSGGHVARKENNGFMINACFDIKNSLLVRTYPGEVNSPDAVQINSNNQPVLPGTSIAGAIRARAERIVNTFIKNETESKRIIRNLFGWAEEKGQDDNSLNQTTLMKNNIKSKVVVEESIISHCVPEVQTRIKIDRFTGGALGTALLQEVPLWPESGKTNMLTIKIKIKDWESHEAGLMLLVVKDLWNEDLPLGGGKAIGRGVLSGQAAEIMFKGEKIVFSRIDKDSLVFTYGEEKKESLEEFVRAFQEECERAGEDV